MLKGLNPPVGVFFETDNLYTLSENTEFMLSFLATFAQEESVKKSEAMNWSLQQRFKDGKLLTPAPLGYDRPKDVTGRYIKYAPLTINESEARIVRFIYDAYLAGWSQSQIADILTDTVALRMLGELMEILAYSGMNRCINPKRYSVLFLLRHFLFCQGEPFRESNQKCQSLRDRNRQPDALQFEECRQGQQKEKGQHRLRIDKRVGENVFLGRIIIRCRNADEREKKHRSKEIRQITDNTRVGFVGGAKEHAHLPRARNTPTMQIKEIASAVIYAARTVCFTPSESF